MSALLLHCLKGRQVSENTLDNKVERMQSNNLYGCHIHILHNMNVDMNCVKSGQVSLFIVYTNYSNTAHPFT